MQGCPIVKMEDEETEGIISGTVVEERLLRKGRGLQNEPSEPLENLQGKRKRRRTHGRKWIKTTLPGGYGDYIRISNLNTIVSDKDNSILGYCVELWCQCNNACNGNVIRGEKHVWKKKRKP